MEKNNKVGLLGLIVILTVFIGSVYLFPSMPKKIGLFYSNLTNPISYLFFEDEGKAVNGAVTHIENNLRSKGKVNIGASIISPHQIMYYTFDMLTNEFEEKFPEPNSLVNIITIGNKESQFNLNLAIAKGEYFIPYHVFSHEIFSEKNDNWYYTAKHSDACSVILYGYSWFINLPAKILAEINILALDEPDDFPATWFTLIDIIINIFSLIIEVPIALFNTIIGAVIAFIFHPWNSICSFLGMFYYAFSTTFTAVWEFLVMLVAIPYNLLFDW